ncbi:glycosyltransferase family 4 protein [Allohahella marinimesophila]|uniref:TIGR03087 family PEP-CTERM/XrtA system glycosyltransferase n=1 Tax=Allohahella marinimesophila TaxID=1054972 RepID=A0ABP7Q8N0_9GAMM
MQTNEKTQPKVLWLSHFAPFPPKGGAEQRSYNMLVEIGKGVDLTFIGLAHKSRVEAYFQDYEVGLTKIQTDFETFCTRVELVRHGQFNRKLNRYVTAFKSILLMQPYDYVYLSSKIYQQRVNQALALEDFDVIHVDSIGLWQFIADKSLSAKLILNHHNIESVMLARRAEQAASGLSAYLAWQSRKLIAIEREACKQVELNMVCSDLDAVRLRDLHQVDNVKVVPNGVDLHYFTRSTPYDPSGAHLLFVGGLDWYPNRDAAIFIARSVWPLVKKALPNATCSVVGRGSVEMLDELAQADSGFTAPGFVDDIRPVFEAATVFICPIRDGGGTKLKVLDAMAMGVPLVAHPVACEGIAVEEGRTVRFAETAEDFCDALIDLFTNRHKLEEMAGRERELIERSFSYESIGADLREVYK